MTQEAVVKKILPGNKALVSVSRKTACGGNCENCESCIVQNDLSVPAFNKINAKTGDTVLIESETSSILKAELLVYVMPLVFFIASYLIPYLLNCPEKICILISFVGLILGGIAVVFLSKRFKKFDFTIIDFIS